MDNISRLLSEDLSHMSNLANIFQVAVTGEAGPQGNDGRQDANIQNDGLLLFQSHPSNGGNGALQYHGAPSSQRNVSQLGASRPSTHASNGYNSASQDSTAQTSQNEFSQFGSQSSCGYCGSYTHASPAHNHREVNSVRPDPANNFEHGLNQSSSTDTQHGFSQASLSAQYGPAQGWAPLNRLHEAITPSPGNQLYPNNQGIGAQVQNTQQAVPTIIHTKAAGKTDKRAGKKDTRPPYTSSELRQIEALMDVGKDKKYLGALLGRTSQVVYLKYKRMKGDFGDAHAAEKQQKRKRAQGDSDTQGVEDDRRERRQRLGETDEAVNYGSGGGSHQNGGEDRGKAGVEDGI